MSPKNEQPTAETIQQLARQFMSSRVLLTAVELDVFNTLAGDEKTSAEIAGMLRSDPRATDRLLNALCGLDLLQKREGRFSNTAAGKKLLVKDGSEYLANLAHMAHMWGTWTTLTDAVRTGSAVVARGNEGWSEHRRQAFIDAMHARARRQAPVVAGLLDLSKVDRVLDVGGGSGIFTAAFAQERDGLTGTVFDLPEVLPITRVYLEQAGMTDRIDTAAGNYNTDPLPGGYDLVFCSAIIHIENDEGNRALVRKCAAALNPGGQLVIQDFVMDDDRVQPPHGAMFSLNMLVATVRGDTFTESEMRQWFEAAGLRDVRRIDTDFGTPLMIGRKP